MQDVQRAVAKLENEMFKSIADGRGRKLKCEATLNLHLVRVTVLRRGDRHLLETTLFKAADNATVMRHAKGLIN